MKTRLGNLFFLHTLIVGLGLMPAGRVLAQPYTFGPEVRTAPSANITYNAVTGIFQYTDAEILNDGDSAYIPLSGNAASVIMTVSGWTASLHVNISARPMTATSTASAPHVYMRLVFASSKTNYLVIELDQHNNTAGGDNSDYPDGYYGTAARFAGYTNGVPAVTTPLGNSQPHNGTSYLQLSGETGPPDSPATESMSNATGVLTFSYDPSTNILTGYYDGTPIGSISLASWGPHLPVALIVQGGSGEGVGAAPGTDTASDFYVSRLPVPPVTITTRSSPATGGTTSGGGSYTNGQSVTVTADPNACYDFANWTRQSTVVSTNLSYSFTVTVGESLVANFTPKKDLITTASNPANGGTASGGGAKNCGSTVTVTAHAHVGFRFENWTEGATVLSTNVSYKFAVSGDVELTANFVNIARPTLTLTSPTGNETTTNSTLNLAGKAKDNVAVTGVYYSVSGSAWVLAETHNVWSNWSATVPFATGSNVIQIYAHDSTGLNSAIKTVIVVRNLEANFVTFPIDTTGDVTEPQIQCAFDGSNYLVVYQTSANVCQFISPSGELLSGELGLNGNGDPPSVAFDGTNYLTAWESYLGGASYEDSTISGTFVGPNEAVGNPGQLVQSTTVGNFWSMVYGGGVYFLTWVDAGGQGRNGRVLEGAMISPSGAEVASDFVISQEAYQTEGGQGATAFDGSNFLTTWAGLKGGVNINGRVISPAGNFVSDPFVIYTNSASASEEIICALFDGTKYLVLFSPFSAQQSPGTWHIQGRFVTTSGLVMSKEISLTKDAGPQIVPGGAFDGTNYLLTWSQGFDPFSKASPVGSIKAGVFDVDGNPISSEFTLFAPQGGSSAFLAPVLFDTHRLQFFSAAVIGDPPLNPTNGIISGAFIVP